MYYSTLIALTVLIQLHFHQTQARDLLSYDPDFKELDDNSVSYLTMEEQDAQDMPLLPQTNEYKAYQKFNSGVNLQDYRRLMWPPFSRSSNLMVSILRNFHNDQNVTRMKREDVEMNSFANLTKQEMQTENVTNVNNETLAEKSEVITPVASSNNGSETIHGTKRKTEMLIKEIYSMSKNFTNTIKRVRENFYLLFKNFSVSLEKIEP